MIGVLGSVNLDLICPVSRLPRPGETVAGGALLRMPGGKGANQALAARRAGARVKLFAAVGTDPFAKEALFHLRKEGVDIDAVRIIAGSTGTALIFVDDHAENVIAISPGANQTHSAEHADAAVAALPFGATLVLQNEIPPQATLAAVKAARKHGVTTLYNAAPILPESRDIAELAGILVVNRGEFEQLAGGGSLEEGIRDWMARIARPVIVTLGADGVLVGRDDAVEHVDAVPVDAIDTTGAGDTFCGYLAAALDSRLELIEAVQIATRAASGACLKRGAQPSIPSAAELGIAPLV